MLISDSPYLLPIPDAWTDHIRTWELALITRGLRPRTIDTRIRHVRRLARDLWNDAGIPSPFSVTPLHLITWSGTHTWSQETRSAHHTSIRVFYRHLTSIHHTPNPAEEALPGIHRIQPPPRPIPEDLLTHALEKAKPRERLILRLAAELGLRAAEISRINQSDFSPHTHPPTLTIHGKGGRTRTLPVPPTLTRLLTRAFHHNYWAFPGLIDGHLSAQWISKLGVKALPDGWTLHTLRHRFATIAYRNGNHDLIAVQHALGHQSVATTQRYAAYDPHSLITITTLTALPPQGANYDTNPQ